MNRNKYSTLGQHAYITLILHNEVDSCGGVHDSPHTVYTGQLQQGVCDPRAPASREPVQGLQEEIQPRELQELHHPGLITALQPLLEPRVVDHGGHLQQADAQLRVCIL